MYVTVEIPHQMPPKVWVTATEAEFYSTIDDSLPDVLIWSAQTGTEILADEGYSSTRELREADISGRELALANLIYSHGLDTTYFYCADEDSGYTVDPIDKFEAYSKALKQDLSRCYIFTSIEEAKESLADDNDWAVHQGAEARAEVERALGALLI